MFLSVSSKPLVLFYHRDRSAQSKMANLPETSVSGAFHPKKSGKEESQRKKGECAGS
jgi:hypothetical protein